MEKEPNKLTKMFNNIFDFLFKSHKCICCNSECDSQTEYRICSRCSKKITYSFDKNTCLKCGSVINGDYDFCITCKDKDYEFDKARSVFAYDDITAPMILNFKYNGLKSYAKDFAHMLHMVYSSSDLIFDSVTYVPMPEERQKKRGYNQSYELCKEFSLLTGVPMIDALERTNNISKQSTLNANQRAENIKGSFKITDKKIVKDREILIIDDVMTTGATANECAKILIKSGARNVSILTIAKTPTLNLDKN